MAKKKVSDAEMRRNRDFMAAQTERMEQDARNQRLSIESVDRVFDAHSKRMHLHAGAVRKHVAGLDAWLAGASSSESFSCAAQTDTTITDDATTRYSLTKSESHVLVMLDRFNACQLASLKSIQSEMEMRQSYNLKTIGKTMTKLIGLGLAERPQGSRAGGRLTNAGRRLAKTFPLNTD